MADNSPSLDDIPIILDQAVIEKLSEHKTNGQEETILIFPDKGKVKVFNEVGAKVWELIDGNHSIREIVAHVKGFYDVPESQIEQDVLAFVFQLSEKHLIRIIHNQ